MTKTYTAHLMDCRGVSDADRREAEQVFCDALEKHFGSVDGVLSALAGGTDSEGWHRAPDAAYFEVNPATIG